MASTVANIMAGEGGIASLAGAAASQSSLSLL